jgi:hypothetical protein
MLTIKRRYPNRKFYLYGGGALILGYAVVMTALVQTNANVDQFAYTPTQQPIVVETPQSTESTANDESQPATETSGMTTTGIIQSQSLTPRSTEPTPTATEPAPVEPATPAEPEAEPTEPATPVEPTEPEPEAPAEPAPEEQEPEEPGIIEDILDPILP